MRQQPGKERCSLSAYHRNRYRGRAPYYSLLDSSASSRIVVRDPIHWSDNTRGLLSKAFTNEQRKLRFFAQRNSQRTRGWRRWARIFSIIKHVRARQTGIDLLGGYCRNCCISWGKSWSPASGGIHVVATEWEQRLLSLRDSAMYHLSNHFRDKTPGTIWLALNDISLQWQL